MGNAEGNIEYRKALKGFSCFENLSQEEIDYLGEHQSIISYLKGETLCKEYGFSSGVKFITRGLIKVYIEGPAKKNIIVKLLTSGDFIGLSSLYGTRTYSYSATTLSDSTVCMISQEAIRTLISTNNKFALDLINWYCVSYDKAYKKLASIGFKNLAGRVADVLLYLEQTKFKEMDIYNFLSRKDLAEMAGVPVESIVRILSEFDKSKIIFLSGKGVTILDHDLLTRYSRGG